MNLRLERNIPRPNIINTKPKWVALFDRMEAGDSLLMSTREAHRFQVAILNLRCRSNQMCTITTLYEGGGKHRVWKVKDKEDNE